MKNFFLVLFGVLFIVSVVVLVVGLLTAAVVPWFGGVRADHIGEIGMGIASTALFSGEILELLFMHVLDRPDRRKYQRQVLSGEKRYGNKRGTAVCQGPTLNH